MNPVVSVDYTQCHGCSLCVLVCPAWQQSRDISLTPKGVARALQHKSASAELSEAAAACIVCGACGVVCPQDVDPVSMMAELRVEIRNDGVADSAAVENTADTTFADSAKALLVPGESLQQMPVLLATILEQLSHRLKTTCAVNISADILSEIAIARPISSARLDRFLAPLKNASMVIVDDGLLFRNLLRWLPGHKVLSLGSVLSRQQACSGLGPNDLYIINSRAYHADYNRLLPHYDKLRHSTKCLMNLDLQRVAQPVVANNEPDTGLQIQNILEGRQINRVIVEDIQDADGFRKFTTHPVYHVAEFVDNA